MKHGRLRDHDEEPAEAEGQPEEFESIRILKLLDAEATGTCTDGFDHEAAIYARQGTEEL